MIFAKSFIDGTCSVDFQGAEISDLRNVFSVRRAQSGYPEGVTDDIISQKLYSAKHGAILGLVRAQNTEVAKVVFSETGTGCGGFLFISNDYVTLIYVRGIYEFIVFKSHLGTKMHCHFNRLMPSAYQATVAARNLDSVPSRYLLLADGAVEDFTHIGSVGIPGMPDATQVVYAGQVCLAAFGGHFSSFSWSYLPVSRRAAKNRLLLGELMVPGVDASKQEHNETAGDSICSGIVFNNAARKKAGEFVYALTRGGTLQPSEFSLRFIRPSSDAMQRDGYCYFIRHVDDEFYQNTVKHMDVALVFYNTKTGEQEGDGIQEFVNDDTAEYAKGVYGFDAELERVLDEYEQYYTAVRREGEFVFHSRAEIFKNDVKDFLNNLVISTIDTSEIGTPFPSKVTVEGRIIPPAVALNYNYSSRVSDMSTSELNQAADDVERQLSRIANLVEIDETTMTLTLPDAVREEFARALATHASRAVTQGILKIYKQWQDRAWNYRLLNSDVEYDFAANVDSYDPGACTWVPIRRWHTQPFSFVGSQAITAHHIVEACFGDSMFVRAKSGKYEMTMQRTGLKWSERFTRITDVKIDEASYNQMQRSRDIDGTRKLVHSDALRGSFVLEVRPLQNIHARASLSTLAESIRRYLLVEGVTGVSFLGCSYEDIGGYHVNQSIDLNKPAYWAYSGKIFNEGGWRLSGLKSLHLQQEDYTDIPTKVAYPSVKKQDSYCEATQAYEICPRFRFKVSFDLMSMALYNNRLCYSQANYGLMTKGTAEETESSELSRFEDVIPDSDHVILTYGRDADVATLSAKLLAMRNDRVKGALRLASEWLVRRLIELGVLSSVKIIARSENQLFTLRSVCSVSNFGITGVDSIAYLRSAFENIIALQMNSEDANACGILKDDAAIRSGCSALTDAQKAIIQSNINDIKDLEGFLRSGNPMIWFKSATNLELLSGRYDPTLIGAYCYL